jgi:DnaJ-class molecular chaperone
MIIITHKTCPNCYGTGLVTDWLSESKSTACKQIICPLCHGSGVRTFITHEPYTEWNERSQNKIIIERKNYNECSKPERYTEIYG